MAREAHLAVRRRQSGAHGIERGLVRQPSGECAKVNTAHGAMRARMLMAALWRLMARIPALRGPRGEWQSR